MKHNIHQEAVFSESLDRMVGCFRGLAVGDALGAPVEFKDFGSFELVTDYRETKHFNLPAGFWTDDTSMALCLADSLVEQNGYNSHQVMLNYVRWYKWGLNSSTGSCFDIGVQTRTALENFIKNQKLDASSKTDSAGNGVLMRLAPAAIVSLNLSDDDSEYLFRISALDTHNNKEAMDSTVLFGFLLKNLLQGFGKSESFESAIHLSRVDRSFADRIFHVDEYEVKNSGYCVTSFAAAWFAFKTSMDFEETVLKAVNLGGDADTIAAIAGQMAGAYYGDNGIPEKWRANLHDSERFPQLSEKFSKVDKGVVKVRFDNFNDVVGN